MTSKWQRAFGGRGPRTVMERCLFAAGPIAGAKVNAFVIQWVVATADADWGEQTAEQVADFWGESHRTTYRRLAEFRRIFPEMSTPHPIAQAVRATRIEASNAGSVPVTEPHLGLAT